MAEQLSTQNLSVFSIQGQVPRKHRESHGRTAALALHRLQLRWSQRVEGTSERTALDSVRIPRGVKALPSLVDSTTNSSEMLLSTAAIIPMLLCLSSPLEEIAL